MPDGLPRNDNVTKLDRDPPAFEDAMKYVRDHKTTDQVRQGTTDKGVRYVLAISLGGALLALLAVYAYFVPG